MTFNFDFIGLQNYFPVVVRYNPLIPIIQASEVKAVTRKVPHTALGWEINPDSFYRILKRFWLYGGVKEIIVSESGAFFKDELVDGVIDDRSRIDYFQRIYLRALLRAKKEGVNIKGFFRLDPDGQFRMDRRIQGPFRGSDPRRFQHPASYHQELGLLVPGPLNREINTLKIKPVHPPKRSQNAQYLPLLHKTPPNYFKKKEKVFNFFIKVY